MRPKRCLPTALALGTILAALTGAACMVLPSTGAAQEAQTTNAESRNLYHVYVDGMACPMCAFSIKRRIEGMDGVRNVSVDMAESRFSVTVDPGKELDREQIRATVEDAGFTLRAIEERHAPAE